MGGCCSDEAGDARRNDAESFRLPADLNTRGLTLEELAAAAKAGAALVAIRGKVYNVGSFLKSHPGGQKILLDRSGTDATTAFTSFHPPRVAETYLPKFLLCDLVDVRPIDDPPVVFANSDRAPPPASASEASGPQQQHMVHPPGPLTTTAYRPFQLVASELDPSAFDVRLLTFAVPRLEEAMLPGQDIMVLEPTSGKARPYTPLSPPVGGRLVIAAKVYATGRVSSSLGAATPGGAIPLRGPCGSFAYLGNGHFRLPAAPNGRAFTSVALIAGGIGVTPMLAVCRAAAAEGHGSARFALLYTNSAASSVPMRAELETLAAHPSRRFDVTFTVTATRGAKWPYAVGRISAAAVGALPAPGVETLVVICGPPGFVRAAVDLAAEAGHATPQIVAL